MPRAALSPDEIEAFRDRLCEVATRRFAQHGTAGVTLRAIAAELGVSPMTPYRYFGSRDEIIVAVRTAAFSRFAAALEAAFARADDPGERLHALGDAYVGFVRREPHGYRIMFEMNRPEDAGDADLARAQQRAWEPLRRAIALAVDAGVLAGEPDALAPVFWAGLHGIASLDLAGTLPPGHTLETLSASMQRTLLEGNRDRSRSHEETA